MRSTLFTCIVINKVCIQSLGMTEISRDDFFSSPENEAVVEYMAHAAIGA